MAEAVKAQKSGKFKCPPYCGEPKTGNGTESRAVRAGFPAELMEGQIPAELIKGQIRAELM